MANRAQISGTDRLKQTSHQAALISGIGALIILGALVYGTLQLVNLSNTIDDKKVKLSGLQDEVQASERQVEVLREQKDELTNAIEVHDSAPITALVKPRASVRELTPDEALNYSEQYKWYEFWIEIPEDKKASITSVTYFMNHPSFPEPVYVGRGEDYRTGYFGWGALSNVIVTITLRDGTEKKLDFNQHAAIYP